MEDENYNPASVLMRALMDQARVRMQQRDEARAQLAAAQKRIAELEDLLASARAQINNLASSLSYLDSKVNEFASASAGSSFRMANIADAKTVYNKIDAVLTEPSA